MSRSTFVTGGRASLNPAVILAMVAGAMLSACSTVAGGEPPRLVWTPTWYASPEPSGGAALVLNHQTIRQIVHVSAGGRYVRVRLSNAYGTTPLHLDAVGIALRDRADKIRPASSVRLTFQGSGDVTIAPGAYAISDPIAFDLPPQADLAVSTYVSGPVAASSAHLVQRSAVYLANGDAIGAPTLPMSASHTSPNRPWVWVDEVEVAASPARLAVVAFGDSITDGVGPGADSDATWPDVLYGRLRAAGVELSVINGGISGNRLLHSGSWAPFGAAALARFDSDVLAQPSVGAVIVLIGINDIGQVRNSGDADFVSAEEIERGLGQLAERAHEKGLKLYVGTLTPFKACIIPGYYSELKEQERQAVNAWIRSSSVFDGVADFDKALEDPAAPGQMLPLYDSGDHLHPSAAGDTAIAEAVPLKWFKASDRRFGLQAP